MNIDWTRPLQTKHEQPREAQLLPPDGITQRRRVKIGRKAGWSLNERDINETTTYLMCEAGTCRGDGLDSPFDLVNVP